MSDNNKDSEVRSVNIEEWVERARADPLAYVERQATEVLLTSLGMSKEFGTKVVLKGGILMGILYESPRQTADVDFSILADPVDGIAEKIAVELDANFPRAAAELGYPDLMCRVQSFSYTPKDKIKFTKFDGPSVNITVGYAKRGSKQEKGYLRGQASKILDIDISFKEPVGFISVLIMRGVDVRFSAYSIYDMVSEKIRALLQQESRNRFRHQDIYDIFSLISRFSLDEQEKHRVLRMLIEKSEARNIVPTKESLSDPEVRRRAEQGWEGMKVEIGAVPDFDACFSEVEGFYRSLPWQS